MTRGIAAFILMARYLIRRCPRCTKAFWVRCYDSNSAATTGTVNGHCFDCGHTIVWAVVRGNRSSEEYGRRARAQARSSDVKKSVAPGQSGDVGSSEL